MVFHHARRIARAVFPAVMVLLAPAIALQVQDTGDRASVPSDAAHQEARGLIREVYGEEYEKAKTSTQKLALAKKLLQEAIFSEDDTVRRFVLFEEAREKATEAGDAETALQAIDEMAEAFQVERLQMKAATVAKLVRSARSAEQRKALATSAVGLVDEALAGDDYDLASQLVGQSQDAARKARDLGLVKRIVVRKKEVEEAAKAYAQVKDALAQLEDQPVDPGANLAAGKYFCFIKGDWEKGIPMLALGSDARLKALSVKELKGVALPEDEVKLADGWWELAQEEAGAVKDSLLLHAGSWYRQAQPKVTSSLLKAKLSGRLEEIAQIGQPISETASVRPRPGKRPPRIRAVKPFDPAAAELLGTLRGHTSWVRGLVFSPDASILVSGSSDRTVRFWDVATGQLRGALPRFKVIVWDIVLSPDGSLLAAAHRDRTISLWRAGTGQFRGVLLGHTEQVWSLAFSPGGSVLASGSADFTVKLWHVATGKLRGTFEGHTGEVRSVAFSPDGSTLASGSGDRTVKLWNVATGELRGTLDSSASGTVYCLAFSPDGSTLASASSYPTILLWDMATGKLRRALRGHRSVVYCVVFHPDGSLLATGSADGTVKLWDLATGEVRRTLADDTALMSVAFSPDGSILATGDQKTVKLWGPPARKRR